MTDKALDTIISYTTYFLAVLAIIAICLVVFSGATSTPPETPQQKCEAAGGMYFGGSALSTPNCVFPPEGAQ